MQGRGPMRSRTRPPASATAGEPPPSGRGSKRVDRLTPTHRSIKWDLSLHCACARRLCPPCRRDASPPIRGEVCPAFAFPSAM